MPGPVLDIEQHLLLLGPDHLRAHTVQPRLLLGHLCCEPVQKPLPFDDPESFQARQLCSQSLIVGESLGQLLRLFLRIRAGAEQRQNLRDCHIS